MPSWGCGRRGSRSWVSRSRTDRSREAAALAPSIERRQGVRRGDAAVTLAVVTPAVSNIKLRLAFLREYPTPAQLCNHRCTIASHGIRGRDKRLARA